MGCVNGGDFEWKKGRELTVGIPRHRKDHGGDPNNLVWEKARGWDLINLGLGGHKLGLSNCDELKCRGSGQGGLDLVKDHELMLV